MDAVRDTPNGEGLKSDGTKENLEESLEQNSPAPHFFNSPPCCIRHTFRLAFQRGELKTAQDCGSCQNTMQ